MKLKEWTDNLGHKQVKYRRFLGYGDFGSGKTYFAGTCPDPFILDADRGLLTLDRAGTLPPANRVLELSDGDDIFRIVKDVLVRLRDLRPPFDVDPPKTFILDGMTGLNSMLLRETMRDPGQVSTKLGPKDPDTTKPEFDHWHLLRSRSITIFDLLKDLPMHVYATAGVLLDKDETTGGYVAGPNLQGAAKNLIGHAFDEVYFFDQEGKGDKIKYVVYTKNYGIYHAKTRLGLPTKVESPTFDALFSHVKTGSK